LNIDCPDRLFLIQGERENFAVSKGLSLPKKVFTAEQIVAKLRETEVALANGRSVSLACRDAGTVDADFVSALAHEGRTVRMLTLIDGYSRQCLAINVARRQNSFTVIEQPADDSAWRAHAHPI
jgi:hypothetical protein